MLGGRLGAFSREGFKRKNIDQSGQGVDQGGINILFNGAQMLNASSGNVYLGGHPVCHNGWDYPDATVVCKYVA